MSNYPPIFEDGQTTNYCVDCCTYYKSARGLKVHRSRQHKILEFIPASPGKPQRKGGTVEMVKVEWLLKNLTSSVDGYNVDEDGRQGSSRNYNFWIESSESVTMNIAGMVKEKSVDYQFGNVVGTILHRGFRVPITVGFKQRVLNGRNQMEYRMGNGHHRLTAAILLVLEEIPVYWNPHPDWDNLCTEKSDTEELRSYREWKNLHHEMRKALAD